MATYTEFYCDASTGANINAGDKTANGVVTSTNGDWGNAAANRFTAAAGTPFSGVNVGDFASVYLDGATTAVYIGRVTAVNGGGASLDISATAKSGTAPTTGATGRSCTTGGAWKGPNATEDFPFDFVENTMMDASSNTPRVNFKNGTNYAITAAVAHAKAGPMRFEGYTSTAGDGGRATIDGTIVGASYTMFSLNNVNCALVNLIFQNNGTTGGAAGLLTSASDNLILGCVVNNVRGTGFSISSDNIVIGNEAYGCNQSNGANLGGFAINGGCAIGNISHDNAGSNSYGMRLSSEGFFSHNIADTNGGIGFDITSSIGVTLDGLTAYGNTSDGIKISAASATAVLIQNCLLVKNGGYGINATGGTRIGAIMNCGFGAGTEANTSGEVNAPSGIQESGRITLTSNVSPFVDEADGDFRLNNTAGGGALLRGTGFGTFTQTAASYTGTQSYPDVGAVQHQETASSGGSFILGG